MKALKKLLALTLAIFMILSVAACHPKDEVAITVGDVEITSALYMYALLEADSAARSKVDSDIAASSSSSSTTTTKPAVDYYAQKIEGKKYTDWVKDTALDRCLEMAYYEYICAEKGIKLSDEELANVDYAVDYYWSYYGYAAIYEPNGVGKETFKRAIMSDYLKDAYFFSIYGEGGEKEVADSELEKKVLDTYLTAEVLQASITSTMKDEEKTNLKNRFKDYEKRLNKGEKFETIYNEYYEIKEDTTTSSNTSSNTSSTVSNSSTTDSSDTTSSEEKEEEKTYKFPYATVLADEKSETSYANALYADVAKLKDDEVKYIEAKDKVTIVIRRELKGDELRMDELKELTLWNEKSEEFEKAVADAYAKLEYEVNNFAIDQFKVKSIVYPTY